MNTRFLNECEYIKTKELSDECFGKSEDADDYYKNEIQYNRVAVTEDEGIIISMVHLKRVILQSCDEKTSDAEKIQNSDIGAWYICYVATAESERHKGHMKNLMNFVLDKLKNEREKLTFLTPVDKSIYRSLGFDFDFKFSLEDRDTIYAEDDLSECSVCVLDEQFDKSVLPDYFSKVKIRGAQKYTDISFEKLTAPLAAKLYDLFCIRPNLTCDCSPINNVAWSENGGSLAAFVDGRCMLIIGRDENGEYNCCLPYCREEEMPYYFRLMEKYFNKILKCPVKAVWTDEKGINCLLNAGMLARYEVTENKEIYDYIYNGDDLRSLAGRKYSKKRNHINKFEQEYYGRWEYRTLTFSDRKVIEEFMENWDKEKVSKMHSESEVSAAGENIDETLYLDVFGVEPVLNCEELMEKVRAGGIFIDGKLKAFSMGIYNSIEKMAVIETEKADADIDGLYQLINREFLIHEFPDAKIINREDDVGIMGLRQAKMSYYPIMFAKRFTIRQYYECYG